MEPSPKDDAERAAELAKYKTAADELFRRDRDGTAEPVHLLKWFRRDTWTSEEGLLLIAGMDPDETEVAESTTVLGRPTVTIKKTQTLSGLDLSRRWGEPIRERLDEYIHRFRDLTVIWTSGTHANRNDPPYYVEWAKRKQFDVPWLEWAQELRLLTPAAPRAEQPLRTRERDTVLKLIIGMAIAGYKFDPTARKNAATQEIANDIAGLGLSVDVDTVRNWLKEAACVLPPLQR